MILEKLLGEPHVVFELVESHLRLDHPKLGQVARRIAVLGAKRRAECVNFGERRRENLAFELAADRQIGRLGEKILLPIDLAVGRARRLLQIQRRHAEHLPRAFAVRGGDDRRLHVEKIALLEKRVDRVGQRVAHAKSGAESIAAHAQVGNLAKKFQRVPFFLQRIGRGIGRAVDVNRCDLELDRLALRRRFNQYAAGFEAAAGGNLFKRFFRDRARFDHELHALETRAVVELDERDAFGIAPRAHPAAQGDFAADR